MKTAKNFVYSIIIFSLLSAGFSTIGIFLPSATGAENPLSSVSTEHVIGHIVWGMMAGAATLSLRYFFLAGVFAILLDADHLVNFIGLDIVSRMGHSVPFAIFAATIMILYSKKDYKLGSIAAAAVFAHTSFDTLLSKGDVFPLFAPILTDEIHFASTDWIWLQLAAVMIAAIPTIYAKIRPKHTMKKSP